jgi:hypothetical protein
MAVENGSLTILDDSNRVLRYSAKGQLLAEYALPAGMKSEQVQHLAGSGGKVKLWAQNSHEFDLEALPAAVDLAESSQAKTGKGLGPGIAAPDRKIVVAAYGLFGSARLVGFDKQSNLYILVEDLYDATPDKLGVEMSIRKYAPSGALLGVARLPSEQSIMFPNRPVEVTGDGKVYAMIAAKGTLSVYAVTLGASYQPKAYRLPLDEGLRAANAASPAALPAQTQPAAVTSFYRVNVFNHARAMTTVAWVWRSGYDWINADFNSGLDP